jgi:elongation factor Tu
MAWFRRKNDESLDPQYLLAQANAAAPAQPMVASGPGIAAAGFRLTIGDVFAIKGRGTVVTGQIETGAVHKNSTVRLTRTEGTTLEVRVDGIEMFRKVVESASAGDNVGLLLRGVTRDDVGAGDILSN